MPPSHLLPPQTYVELEAETLPAEWQLDHATIPHLHSDRSHSNPEGRDKGKRGDAAYKGGWTIVTIGKHERGPYHDADEASWHFYAHAWLSVGIKAFLLLTGFAFARTAWPSRLGRLALVGALVLLVARDRHGLLARLIRWLPWARRATVGALRPAVGPGFARRC
jgi:hypothetical protein